MTQPLDTCSAQGPKEKDHILGLESCLIFGETPTLGFDFPEAPITSMDTIHIINGFLKSYVCVNQNYSQNARLVCSNLFADVPVFVYKSN